MNKENICNELLNELIRHENTKNKILGYNDTFKKYKIEVNAIDENGVKCSKLLAINEDEEIKEWTYYLD